jgi:membrane associated rhomboid family serine protease
VKPFKPPVAVATNTLIGVCVAVQLAVTIGGSVFDQAIDFGFGLIPARIFAAAQGRVDPFGASLTLLSHIFLHGGWVHLGFNIVFLAWVGRYVEWIIGRTALLGLFLAGGAVGGLFEVLLAPGLTMPVVGASGAISAVFGAYAVLFAQSRVTGRRILGVRLSADTLTALWYAATWIGLQLLTGLVFNDNGGANGLGEIAIWTHIGGFLTGLVVARAWGRGPELG